MILIGILGLLATGGLIVAAALLSDRASRLHDDAMWTRRDDEFMDEDFERHRRAQLMSIGETLK